MRQKCLTSWSNFQYIRQTFQYIRQKCLTSWRDVGLHEVVSQLSGEVKLKIVCKYFVSGVTLSKTYDWAKYCLLGHWATENRFGFKLNYLSKESFSDPGICVAETCKSSNFKLSFKWEWQQRIFVSHLLHFSSDAGSVAGTFSSVSGMCRISDRDPQLASCSSRIESIVEEIFLFGLRCDYPLAHCDYPLACCDHPTVWVADGQKGPTCTLEREQSKCE